MEVKTQSASDAEQGFILPANNVEYTSVKRQMIIGALLIIVVCFVNYIPTLHLGLLLDDFNNVDYAYRACHGDPADFLSNFYSSWGHIDVMKAYRPIISLSFFTDYLLFGLNYVGYHVSNIVMLALCSIFVSLITLELTGMYGNRSRASAALWAGLLFAADPLHVESVTWIIGRVDVLCCVFYFASVFCFMRFRLLRHRSLLIMSLVLALLALGSKEMAVILPVVQTMICFLPIPGPRYKYDNDVEKLIQSDLKYAFLFWIELACFTVMRFAFLGTLFGGYGNTDLNSVLNSWRNFADRASIYKVFVPMNEELKFPSHTFDIGIKKIEFGLAQTVLISFGTIFIAAALRLFQSRKLLAPLIFLTLWAAVAILPTFQIWHIYPNLVGSRLFFTSSAPLCIAIALCALPATDAIGRFGAKLWTYVGVTALTILFIGWSYILQVNLQPWHVAAKHMKTFSRQTTELATGLKPGERVLLLNLPPDYQGAGLVTRAWYVEQICRPPFAEHDFSDRFISVEPVVSGSHEFLWPGELTNLLQDKRVVKKVIWNPAKGEFAPFSAQTEAGNSAVKNIKGNDIRGNDIKVHNVKGNDIKVNEIKVNNFLGATIEPGTAWSGSESAWKLESDRLPGMEIDPNFRRLIPAKLPQPRKKAPSAMSFWLPVQNVDPISHDYVRIDMNFHGTDKDLGSCRFVWKSTGLNPPGQNLHKAIIQKNGQGEYYVWLGRYRSWILNDAPTAIGLELPGGSYSVDLKGFELMGDNALKPTISVDNNQFNYPTPGTVVHPKTKDVQIHWQALMPSVSNVVLRVSKPNLVFDANSEPDIINGPPGNLATEIKRPGNKGSINISELQLKEGTTEIDVIGKNSNGDVVGLPSEPISIKF